MYHLFHIIFFVIFISFIERTRKTQNITRGCCEKEREIMNMIFVLFIHFIFFLLIVIIIFTLIRIQIFKQIIYNKLYITVNYFLAVIIN